MFTKFLIFRKKEQLDTILEDFDFPERKEVKDLYQNSFFGCDKIGRPLHIDQIGTVNVPGLLRVSNEERVFKYIY